MVQQRIIIIDDERLARVELRNLLSAFPKIEIVGEANNADNGTQLIKDVQPDLIFLDIQMPERSGFDMLEDLEDAPPVIFTTAYNEYAIKAFEFNALDYLLKPINTERLKESIERAFVSKKQSLLEKKSKEQLQNLYPSPLYLKDGDQSYFVELSDISLFSSFGNYVKVHFEGKSILIHRSLNLIEKRLSDDIFFRANRYSIINIKHIAKVDQGSRAKIKVILKSGHDIEISERKSIVFRERWGV